MVITTRRVFAVLLGIVALFGILVSIGVVGYFYQSQIERSKSLLFSNNKVAAVVAKVQQRRAKPYAELFREECLSYAASKDHIDRSAWAHRRVWVTNAEGNPLAGAQVRLLDFPSVSAECKDRTGSVTLPIPQGEHDLEAFAPGFKPAIASWETMPWEGDITIALEPSTGSTRIEVVWASPGPAEAMKYTVSVEGSYHRRETTWGERRWRFEAPIDGFNSVTVPHANVRPEFAAPLWNFVPVSKPSCETGKEPWVLRAEPRAIVRPKFVTPDGDEVVANARGEEFRAMFVPLEYGGKPENNGRSIWFLMDRVSVGAGEYARVPPGRYVILVSCENLNDNTGIGLTEVALTHGQHDISVTLYPFRVKQYKIEGYDAAKRVESIFFPAQASIGTMAVAGALSSALARDWLARAGEPQKVQRSHAHSMLRRITSQGNWDRHIGMPGFPVAESGRVWLLDLPGLDWHVTPAGEAGVLRATIDRKAGIVTVAPRDDHGDAIVSFETIMLDRLPLVGEALDAGKPEASNRVSHSARYVARLWHDSDTSLFTEWTPHKTTQPRPAVVFELGDSLLDPSAWQTGDPVLWSDSSRVLSLGSLPPGRYQVQLCRVMQSIMSGGAGRPLSFDDKRSHLEYRRKFDKWQATVTSDDGRWSRLNEKFVPLHAERVVFEVKPGEVTPLFALEIIREGSPEETK